MVKPEHRSEISSPATAHAGHFGTGRLGQLRRASADGTGGANDEDTLTRRYVTVVVHGLPSSEAGVWHHRGLLEGEIGGLEREFLVTGARKLGPCSAACAVHLITNAKARHSRADGFDPASEIRARNRNVGARSRSRECASGTAGRS